MLTRFTYYQSWLPTKFGSLIRNSAAEDQPQKS